MQAKHFSCVLTTTESIHGLGRRFGTSKMQLPPPPFSDLGCRPFLGSGPVVVDSLFVVAPIVVVLRLVLDLLCCTLCPF